MSFVNAAIDRRGTRAVELLLAHCAELDRVEQPDLRKPVFERLREMIGAELTRRLVFALAGNHRARGARLPV
jgi:hypothetical protein